MKLLDELISVVTPVTLISYLLYTLDPSNRAHFGSQMLYLTSVFVVFGIFHYLYFVHRHERGGSPVELVMKGRPLVITTLGWIASFVFLAYLG